MDSKQLSMGDISLDMSEIYRSMGYGSEPDPQMIATVEALLVRFNPITKPRFRFIESTIDGLSPKGIIMKGLSGAEKYILFVATAGMEFQEEINSLMQEGDIVNNYAADLIGSEIAEATVRECVKAVQATYPSLGVSNPYSTGYCGWNITEQQVIFERFRQDNCGIILNDSCLMYPIKSVSGIIAVGAAVEKREYGCAICGRKDCYKNKLKNECK